MTVIDGTDIFGTEKPVTSERLNKTVIFHGSTLPTAGTNEIPTNGLFLLDNDGIYENTGSIATPTWTLRQRIEGKAVSNANTPSDNDVLRYVNSNTRWEKGTPKKRRIIVNCSFEYDTNAEEFFPPYSYADSANMNQATAAAADIAISAEALTLKRFRVKLFTSSVTNGTARIYDDTSSAASITSMSGGVEYDSGNLSVAFAGGSKVCFSFDPNGAFGGFGIMIAEFEYDSLF